MDPLLVITNDDAGTADDEALRGALWRSSATRARSRSSRPRRPGELDGVLHRAASRRIVVAGGDGSLHAVIAALHRRHDLKHAVVGLLPMGTGNDFARTLGIPLDLEEAARVIVAGEVRPMDLVVDELGEVVVNNVHVGAGAQASRRGARWKERLGSIGVGRANLGKLGYPIGAVLSAFQPPSVHMHVEVDGKVVTDLDQPVLMVAVGNGAQRRRRHRAHPRGRPRGRQGRRDDLPRGRRRPPSSGTPCRCVAGSTTTATTCSTSGPPR